LGGLHPPQGPEGSAKIRNLILIVYFQLILLKELKLRNMQNRIQRQLDQLKLKELQELEHQ
jgi:hypothetical protein